MVDGCISKTYAGLDNSKAGLLPAQGPHGSRKRLAIVATPFPEERFHGKLSLDADQINIKV
jgi:hypothetical protein